MCGMLTKQVCFGRVGKLKRVMALDENDRSGMEDEGLVSSLPRAYFDWYKAVRIKCRRPNRCNCSKGKGS